jgi:hypothetical protein
MWVTPYSPPRAPLPGSKYGKHFSGGLFVKIVSKKGQNEKKYTIFFWSAKLWHLGLLLACITDEAHGGRSR